MRGRLNAVMLKISDISKNNGLRIPHEFGLLIKQMLYFDRYVKILAPEMDLIKDLTPMEVKKKNLLGIDEKSLSNLELNQTAQVEWISQGRFASRSIF